MHRFLIVIEKAENNYSAYSPDLSGCVATGATREDAEEMMHEAIEFPCPWTHRRLKYQFRDLIHRPRM